MDVNLLSTVCVALATAFPCWAFASNTYECTYSKADLDNGKIGQLIGQEKADVEIGSDTFKAYRPHGIFLSSPNLNSRKGDMRIGVDGAKVFVASDDNKSFSIADRIGKSTEQWANCSPKKKEKEPQLDEIKTVEDLTPKQAKNFFLNEKHAFTTNCLVWDDVTMITGKNPAMIIGGAVDMGKNPRWDGREYTFTFNGGSMVARFVPSEKKHKFVIQAGDKFYGCGPSEVDHNFD